jgi:hypothetical protein
VLQQGEKIVALEAKVQSDPIPVLGEAVEGMKQGLMALHEMVANLAGLIGADEDDGPLYPEFKELRATIEGLREKVEGRNKSAPVKRNMTDQDALDVLTGAYKDMSHKDAAEQIGLTYAQVYSCRLEFTFKHVHKDLRDAKWVNPWAK